MEDVTPSGTVAATLTRLRQSCSPRNARALTILSRAERRGPLWPEDLVNITTIHQRSPATAPDANCILAVGQTSFQSDALWHNPVSRTGSPAVCRRGGGPYLIAVQTHRRRPRSRRRRTPTRVGTLWPTCDLLPSHGEWSRPGRACLSQRAAHWLTRSMFAGHRRQGRQQDVTAVAAAREGDRSLSTRGSSRARRRRRRECICARCFPRSCQGAQGH